MKRIICFMAMLALISSGAMAQEETQYLFHGDASIGGFGGVMLEGSLLDQAPMLSVGGGGGALFNNRIFFGGYGMGNVSDGPNFTVDDIDFQLNMGHGGLWMGYLFWPQKVVHFGTSCRLGWGGLEVLDALNRQVVNDDIFVVTPQASVEANVFKFMKVNLAIGYRATLGVNNPLLDERDLSSPTAMLGFYFGWF